MLVYQPEGCDRAVINLGWLRVWEEAEKVKKVDQITL
jgi:hypothetical protein